MCNFVYSISYKDRTYIGSTGDISRRFTEHKNQLKRGVHGNKQLQNIVNKHGIKALRFEPLVACNSLQEVRDLEQAFLDKYYSESFCMNECSSAVGGGQVNPQIFKFLNLDGSKFEGTVFEFCNTYKDTDKSALWKVMKGQKKSYKGWFNEEIGYLPRRGSKVCIEHETLGKHTGYQKDLAEKFKLRPSNLSSLVNGKLQQTKGWRLSN